MESITPSAFALLGVLLFFAVLFLQSGIDKVVDRKGNLAWMEPHFQNSPLRKGVRPLLWILTVFEVSTGVTCAFAAVNLAIVIAQNWSKSAVVTIMAGTRPDDGALTIAKVGLVLVMATLLQLFLGQRLAKAYDAAASLTGYFAIAILGLFLQKP